MLQHESQSQGLKDEACVALCLYGEDLDLAQLSSILGCVPTHSHKKGELGSLGKPYPTDAWILELREYDPFDLEQMFDELLKKLPQDLAAWRSATVGCRSRLDFALHTETGHQARLSAKTLRRVSDLNSDLQIDVYAYKADA